MDKAKEAGMGAVGLTDRNNLYGAIEFYKTCTKKEVKPIIGCDLDVRIDGHHVHVIFLAENNTGYHNLLKLVSKAHLLHKGEVRADEDLLNTYHEGLIVLLPESALTGGGRTVADFFVGRYGKGNVFARLGWNHADGTIEKAAEHARAFELPLVAGDGVYYLSPEDRDARDIVRRIANPTASADGNDRAFISQEVAHERFREYPEALENVEKIVERISVTLELGSWVFPHFEIPEGSTHEDELRKLTEKGFEWRGMEKTPEIEERMNYELSVINEKGFAPYFLAVSDLLNFAKENDILTTTRGSAAGSLVSYLTGITNIDPIAYKLPFERFLNPLRPKAPDVDMDIADVKRDEMIAYAKQKYGDASVAQIGTFGTMMARAAVRDVARALGYSYGVGDRIAKLIPFGSQGFPMTIDKALEMEEELKHLYRSDEDVEIIIDTAKRVEGNARHISVHAAGVVIAPGPAVEYTPVQWDPNGDSVVTQYDMHAVEDAGLLKFDFLGLKNLSVLGNAVKRVKERKGVDIDIENIPLDDEKVFAMLARGETEGVFQLSGGGMTRYLKELEPSSIDDINAMVALYRPGPMESIPQYIARKKNPQLITYLEPRMEKILERSYGIITYQDDVLMTAIEIAGYTWLEADALRKAMGKKIPAEMEAQKQKFIDGCIDHGKISKEKAESIWKLIEPFAAYGFNKAHAASYGKVAYQTAYMKAHHSADFMAALMSADSGNVDKIAVHVAECERMDISVLPPSVNESFTDFTVIDDSTIRFGLDSIKNFGHAAAAAIIDERKSERFESIGDFASRIGGTAINRRSIEALIKAGALDEFGDRASMMEKIEHILQVLSQKGAAPENQDTLFALDTKAPVIDIATEDTTPLKDKLEWEKELIGIYVSGHPTDQFMHELEKYKGSIHAAHREDRPGFPIIIGGVVSEAKTILTKKGERMGFFTIADKEASIEAVAFPKTYTEAKDSLKSGVCVLVKGKLSRRNDEQSLLIDKVKKLG